MSWGEERCALPGRELPFALKNWLPVRQSRGAKNGAHRTSALRAGEPRSIGRRRSVGIYQIVGALHPGPEYARSADQRRYVLVTERFVSSGRAASSHSLALGLQMLLWRRRLYRKEL